MKAEVKMIIGIFTLVLILAIGALSLRSNTSNIPSEILSPFSKSANILSFFSKREKPKYTIYGYLPYWTIEKAKYLDMEKLTDIAYFGLYMDADGNFTKVDENGETPPGYNNWLNNEDLDKVIEKAKKHGVRFALTVIAHVDEDQDKFLDCKECWTTLKNNVFQELDKKKITDVNLNFEYAEYTEEDKAKKFAEFSKYLNQELDKKYGDSKLVVSAFADSVNKQRVSSDIENLSKYTDGIFIMGYDFHRPASDTAGPVAPIGGAGSKSDYDITNMLNDYLTKVPPGKLILGVPYYGYNWVVESTNEYSKRVDDPREEVSSQSQTYEDIMDTIVELKPEIKWDEPAQTPYFTYLSPEYNVIREVYFDNEKSLEAKYKLIKEKNLAGVGIWALGYDGGYTELWNLLYKYFVE